MNTPASLDDATSAAATGQGVTTAERGPRRSRSARQTMTSSAMVKAQRLLDELVDALEVAKAEVPAYSVESLRFLRAEVKVIRRRVENIRKATGDPDEAPAAQEFQKQMPSVDHPDARG